MRIGERLIREDIITPAQLYEGLRAQDQRGGRLGSRLMELGHVDGNTLAECLGRHHGMPPVLDKHLDRASAELRARLPAQVAAQWGAIPVARLMSSQEQIAVAVMDPLPVQAIDQISTALGSQIVLAVAPERMLLDVLTRAYGIAQPLEIVPADVRPTIAPPDDDEAQCDIQIHIHGEDVDEHRLESLAFDQISDEPEEAADEVVAAKETLAARSAPGAAHLARISLKRAVQGSQSLTVSHTASNEAESSAPTNIQDLFRDIRQATGQDRVGDLAICAMRDFSDDHFDVGIIFMVRDRMAIGWKGFVRGRNDGVVEAVALPLDARSAVQHAFETRELYVGPVPHGGTEMDRRLWALLKSGPPSLVAVAPIAFDQETHCLVYAQSSRPAEVAAAIGTELAALVDCMARALGRLVRAAER